MEEILLRAYLWILVISVQATAAYRNSTGVASAMSASMLPSVVASFTDRDYDSIYDKITKTLKTNMFIAVPSFVGLFIIGQPIIKLLFSRYNSVQGGMMLK